MSNLCPQVKFSPLGPLFKMAQTVSSDVKGDISAPASDCMAWLDSIARAILGRLHLLWDYSPFEARAVRGDSSRRFELWFVFLVGGSASYGRVKCETICIAS